MCADKHLFLCYKTLFFRVAVMTINRSKQNSDRIGCRAAQFVRAPGSKDCWFIAWTGYNIDLFLRKTLDANILTDALCCCNRHLQMSVTDWHIPKMIS